jgi:hypothetical protein
MSTTTVTVDSLLAEAISSGRLDSYTAAFNPLNRSRWHNFGAVPVAGGLRAVARKAYHDESSDRQIHQEFMGVRLGQVAELIAYILDGWNRKDTVVALDSKYIAHQHVTGPDVAYVHVSPDGKRRLDVQWANALRPESDLLLIHFG